MKIIFIFIVLLGFIGWSFGVMAAAKVNTVIRVKDGDTVVIMGANRTPYTVRLSGIDAPENGQAWGNKSKQLLKQLIHKKQVRVVAQNKPDRYGRIVARLYLSELDINAYMIENGGAWVYRRYARGSSFAHFYRAENKARKSKRGLWSLENPLSPWEFRNGNLKLMPASR